MRACAVGLCFGAIAPGAARADEVSGPSPAADGPTWLSWSAPPECPPPSAVETRVAEWLGRAFTADEAPRVIAELRWDGDSWQVQVSLDYQDHHGQRNVAVASCQDAADFIAVAVVLTVDPNLAGRFPDAQAREAGARAEEDRAPSEPVENQQEGASPEPRSPDHVDERKPIQRARIDVRGHVTLEVEGSYGPLPGLRPGAALGTGLDVGRQVWVLSARWLPAMDVEPARATAPISFALIGGRLAWSYLVLRGGFSLGPLVSASLGAIVTRQGERERKVEFWGAAGVGATALARLAPWVQLVGELEFEVPFTRPSFVLSDGSLVHEVTLGGRGALGVRFFFPPQ